MAAATPLLLVGDFNWLAGRSATYTELAESAGLTDAWLAAARRTNEDLNTFHDYEPPKHDGERIDWILARRPAVVSEAAIVTHAENGRTPGDHFPVTATIRFG